MTPSVIAMARSAGTSQPKWWMFVPNTVLTRCPNGTCPSITPTSVSAAKSAMTPWA